MGSGAVGAIWGSRNSPTGVKNFKLFEERSDEFLKFSRSVNCAPNGAWRRTPSPRAAARTDVDAKFYFPLIYRKSYETMRSLSFQ